MLNKKKNIQLLIDNFKNFSEKNLIFNVTTNTKISYGDFLNKSYNFCNFLKFKKGLKVGDKILIKLDNSPEYLISIFACFVGGFVACPIDKQIPNDRYKKLIKILKPKYEINSLNKIKFLSKKKNPKIQNKNLICLIIFTSGSTGNPKGIQININEYLGSALAFGKLADYDNITKVYHCLPMHYNAGLLNTFFSAAFFGSEIYIGPQINVFSLINFWHNITKFEINSFHIVPEIANALNKIEVDKDIKIKIEKIDKIISTGSHLYEETKENFEKKYKKRILSCYGLTEIGGPITLQNWEDTFDENSVGRLVCDIKIKINKSKNDNLVFVKTPYMFNSYLLANGKIERPKIKNGYFNTGDIGDYKNNQLYILGRKKEVFKKGSEIISPQNIENICFKSKLILDCAVLTKEDVSKGSKIFLLVEFKRKELSINNISVLKKFLSKQLRKIEYPDKIVPVSKIFRSASGKLKKYDMEKIYL